MKRSICPKCAGNKSYINYVMGPMPCDLCAETGLVMPFSEESDALALLRELNDALAIPSWLQPRVDAVLDRADANAD